MNRQRQIRSIRARKGLLRTSKLDAQGILDYLAQEQPPREHLPSIRKLVKLFREERRIWVTRDVCNEALNLAKAGNKGLVEATQLTEPVAVIPEPVITDHVVPEPVILPV
jgi:hypothetical protein